MKQFGCKTKRQLVDLALRELLRTAKCKEILKLRGKIQWEGDLDELRSARS
jgi:Arc/MetJ family transcription regulator